MQNISTKSFFSELDSINPIEFIENYIDPSEKDNLQFYLPVKIPCKIYDNQCAKCDHRFVHKHLLPSLLRLLAGRNSKQINK